MFTRRFNDEGQTLDWDRQPIRINPSSSQEGIAASLRRAFNAAQPPTASDRDFEELLAQLS